MSETEDLRALMEADRWIDRVSSQRTHLPESVELATLEVSLRALLASLKSNEALSAPLRSEYDTVAATSERLRMRARDLAKTLATSTANARELAALEHEITHVRELLSASEDRELELMEALEPLEETVTAIRAEAQPGVVRRGELLELINSLQGTLNDELVSLRASRERVAAAVAPALRARYEAALARAGASGAAQVVEGRCDGCRIALSPLDFDRFKAQSADVFLDCPACGRLLLP